MVKQTQTKKAAQYSIIANKSYGLYAGYVEATRPQPDGSLHVDVRECRHVARWYGKTGGITSLAAHGLCGPNAGDSRIGAPAPGVSMLTGIVNIFPCAAEAQATLEAARQQ